MSAIAFRFSTSSIVTALLTLVLGLQAGALAQNADEAPKLYELTPASSFQQGCVAPCECPVMEPLPIVGTFVLSPVGFDGLFRVYSVRDVSWDVLGRNAPLHIAGSGTYRIGGEFALMQQLELDLKVGGQPVEHFDSGLVIGGAAFPDIQAVISTIVTTCYNTVITVDAKPSATQPPPLPRHAGFVLHPGESSVELTLFTGGGRSKLAGSIRLFLGDPGVPVIALAGQVGLSVDGADLTAPDFEPDLVGIPEPLHMIQDPKVRSIGSWNTLTGLISFEMHLIAPEGNLPVPTPVILNGVLRGGVLEVSGNNGNVADGTLSMKIKAFEVPLPPPPIDLWFSTEVGFHAGRLSPASIDAVAISPGDLLSRRGHIVRTNHELTARLGFMPIVPDLGLDAVALGPKGDVWFSFEEEYGPMWSERLARYIQHGDLVSEHGFVVRTNEELLAAFRRMPPVCDAGLDAVSRTPDKGLLFSTEAGFFSESLGRKVSHGDLLSDRGRVVMTNQQLLRNFKIVDPTLRPAPFDYGLDVVILRANGEIWFSTETGFNVQRPDDTQQVRWIDDGDLLSTRGYVVARNLDLLSAFAPIEDLASFGLDAAVLVVPPVIGDLDQDGVVDRKDVEALQIGGGGPNLAIQGAAVGDFDGDGDIDQSDFGILQRWLGAEGVPADQNGAN